MSPQGADWWGSEGKGKQGGYRVVTYFAANDLPVFLVTSLERGTKTIFQRTSGTC
jgi:mRNA-degrading endonuclease RelE of RelBE toxin-antitoxin system